MKKNFILLLVIVALISGVFILSIKNVTANDDNTRIVFQGDNTIQLDTTDINKLNYLIDGKVVGTVKVKNGDVYVAPVLNNGKYEVLLPKYVDNSYNVELEISTTEGYELPNNYFLDGDSKVFNKSGSNYILINANQIFNMDFSFKTVGSSDANIPGNMPMFPIVAYFEGVVPGVQMDENGTILIPDNWDLGKVTFKAKTCKNAGKVVPNDGFNVCDVGTEELINVRVEGIANANEINHSVIGSMDRSSVTFTNDFLKYGKCSIHITSIEENGPVNTGIRIESKSLINIKADSPISMSYSFGSAYVNQAIITSNVEKDLSVFFGNNETNISVSGYNVEKIIKIEGGVSSTINADGTANIKLPELSKQTSVKLIVTIKLKDNTKIVRTVNVKRTAIMLDYDNRDGILKAGYVMNKGYLYNNLNHDDNIFNAYLQVILYNDNNVVKYKQVKIDDEKIINKLHENESWSIETFNEDAIILYKKGDIAGVNKVSVFLTNGPIDYNSENLPSLEYGIGSGLIATWED